MRLVTIRPIESTESDPGRHRVAVVLPSGRFLPLGALAAIGKGNLAEEIEDLPLATVATLDTSFQAIGEAISLSDAAALDEVALDPASVGLAAPIPRPGKIIGVGYNYLDHVREQGLERPARPVLFSMFANAVVADAAPIRHPAGTQALDLEAELAVVIGLKASRVAPELALAHVAGYTAANDVTARDWQGQAKALRAGEKGDGQWLRAKGSDTFLPLGPALVTADELGDGRGLAVRSWVTRAADGPKAKPFAMQDGSTSDLLFSVAELISIISAEVTLEPGDIIVTGTPSGVGVFREPQVFLAPGDLVTVEVERIGKLTNPVTDVDGKTPKGSPASRFLGLS